MNNQKILGVLLLAAGLFIVIPYMSTLEPWIICLIGGYLIFKGIDLLQK